MQTPRPHFLLIGSLLACACAHADPGETTQPDDPSAAALASIRAEDIAAHVSVLASDAYEGRFPGSAGEAKTVSYVASTFARLGVAPAIASGYLQPVPLSSQRVDPSSAIVARGPGGELRLGFGQDALFGAPGTAARVEVETSELVFVGYGIVASEYDWDDYAGVDVRGKTVVVLSGDPGPTRSDPAFFKGLALTHHGTFQAKLERARERGAAAILGVHDSEASGLAWAMIAQNGKQKKMQLRDSKAAAATLSGVIPIEKARELLGLAGVDLDPLLTAAARDDFAAVGASLSLRFELERGTEPIDSHNVVGWIRGTERPDEFVVYTAHWDHVGVAPEGGGRDGDRIFNGAVDNATGTAALLELAEAYASLPAPPRRSIVFLATTAEEQGLLGAFHYANNPVFPLADTVAVINMDALFPFGATKGMTVVALGSSELEEYMDRAAKAVGRELYPDPAPQLGAFFRSDHYPFAAKGVPAIFAVGGPAQDPAAGETVDLARFVEFVQQHYHQVSDEYEPERWDLAGVVQDVEIYFRTGLEIANDDRTPNWYADSEFRALRDAMR